MSECEVELKMSEKLRHETEAFPEINWTGFVEKSIKEKVEELSWKEKMLKKIKEEQDITDWSVKLQRASRKGRFNELKKKGLI